MPCITQRNVLLQTDGIFFGWHQKSPTEFGAQRPLAIRMMLAYRRGTGAFHLPIDTLAELEVNINNQKVDRQRGCRLTPLSAELIVAVTPNTPDTFARACCRKAERLRKA